jgi:HAD superfamily hydrolase (TIGR01490 family)
MHIAFFDFDGTITKTDTFVKFVVYATPLPKLIFGLILLSPIIILFKLGFFTNHFAKESSLRFFFSGMKEDEFNKIASKFSIEEIPKYLKQSALDRIEWHKKEGHRLVLVSASIDYWLKPWTESMNMELICTKMQTKDGLMTGWLDGQNCWGTQKVERILEKFDKSEFEYSYAYGDSRGDKEMLEFVDEGKYRPFS